MDYIELHQNDWANEFAYELSITTLDEATLAKVIAMAGYTIMYKIADDWRDGEFRDEILHFMTFEEEGE